MPVSSIEYVRDLSHLKKIGLTDIAVVDISPLLNLPNLVEITVVRCPVRSDVLTALGRRGVKVNSY
jgi:hypothetical protein